MEREYANRTNMDLNFLFISELYLEHSQTSKMKPFSIIVNVQSGFEYHFEFVLSFGKC